MFNSGSLYQGGKNAEPPQLVPNAYNDSAYGLSSYPHPVQTHHLVPPELEFPTQMADSSAFHGTSSQPPTDEMQRNSIFYRAIGATKPTSLFDAKNEQTAFAEPLNGYAPCEGPRPWNFAQCYGFYGEPACPLAKIGDIEDFM